MRMPKGWTLIGTNDLSFGNTETKEDKAKREHRLNKAIENMKIKTCEEIQEDSEKFLLAKKDKEMQLLQAYEDKKLKSTVLIKKAKALKNTVKK